MLKLISHLSQKTSVHFKRAVSLHPSLPLAQTELLSLLPFFGLMTTFPCSLSWGNMSQATRQVTSEDPSDRNMEQVVTEWLKADQLIQTKNSRATTQKKQKHGGWERPILKKKVRVRRIRREDVLWHYFEAIVTVSSIIMIWKENYCKYWCLVKILFSILIFRSHYIVLV
jgi:hypothetical protein